jgi:hypothetical protein
LEFAALQQWQVRPHMYSSERFNTSTIWIGMFGITNTIVGEIAESV